MSEPYEEILEGESMLRYPPPDYHERICLKLHSLMQQALANAVTSRLLRPRTLVPFSAGSLLRPDLTGVATSTGKPFLVAEIIHAQDHRVDTVVKKELYERFQIPRLWILDARYDNAEVYHGSPIGLVLKKMLAGKEPLEEPLLGSFAVTVVALFKES